MCCFSAGEETEHDAEEGKYEEDGDISHVTDPITWFGTLLFAQPFVNLYVCLVNHVVSTIYKYIIDNLEPDSPVLSYDSCK